MAKQIEDIVVRLGLEKFEGLDKIRSSFRDLSKVTKMSEQDIIGARDSIFEFAKTAGNSEAVTKGLVSALQGLRSQADFCGDAYRSLADDIRRVGEVQRGATDALMAQRNALVATFSETTRNVRALEEHRAALVRIQEQTRANSRAYDTLGSDIAQVGERITEVTRVATALNVALSRAFPATATGVRATLTSINAGIELQRQVINDIDLRSGRERRLAATIEERATAEQRLNRALTAQRQLTFGESVRSGREAVRTAAAAFNETTLTTGFYSAERIGQRMGDLPNTTAGLNQELAELSERLVNTTRGSSTYVDVALRMAEIQKQLRTDILGTADAFRQLNIAESGVSRREGKLAGIQEYYATQGPLAPGVGGFRDPATGAMIAAGARTPGRIRVNEAQYALPIGPQAFPEAAKRATTELERAYADMTRIQTRAGVERVELQAKYNQLQIDKLLEGLDLEGAVRKKAFDTELADFDRRMAIADKRRGRRLTGMQLAQGVGAALSGGIFGGPEGLIGGLGGLAVGGVGGAFAGAAAGAQVAGLRQAGAAAAAYAAEVRRLQLALQGIVTSFDDYKAALAAVASTSSTFNVPIREATQQFTKLSAAVLGSGGSIKDAENTFKGLTASVLATGGSVEDINGALVAAAQVFSKGKVTAEELRGQIGERLAGAFALFAESSGRSSKGLDAALKSGEVTIADFVKFTEFSLAKYGRTAQIIAASPEQAGARLDNALKALQQSVGDSLGPAGAAFQDFAARSIRGLDKLIEKLIELKAVQPGAGYYQQQVLEGSLSIPQLENRLLRAGQRETALRQGAASAGLGFIADLLPDISAATKEARILEEALIKVRLIEKETNKERKQRQTEEDTADREKLGASYLQAIEQREEALLQARLQREEQIADIRKQSLEQARQLERQFADERRALEREIAQSKRGTADIEEDIARQQRLLAGEDPRLIEAEQRIADVYREARERDIKIKEDYTDREFNRARTIADFQKNTADQINKANEAYAKTLGNIHRTYARDVGKILDEASGKTARRLAAAGKLITAISDLQALQAQRVQVGASPVPSAADMPPVYKQKLDDIERFNKQLLQSRRQQQVTADSFFTAYADQPQFEDIAGLQPLPITRMQRQAARPLRRMWERTAAGDTRKVNSTFNTSVLERIQRMQQIIDNWDPVGSQWKEIQNNLRETKRSRMAGSVPAAVLTQVAQRMWSEMRASVQKAGGLATSGGQMLGSQRDFSEYLTDKQLRILQQGLRATLEPAYTSQFGPNKNPGALDRALGTLRPAIVDFRKAIFSLLEQEAVQGRVYAEKALQKLGVSGIKAQYRKNNDPDTIQQRFNQLFKQPDIVPGVGKDFEGAMLPGGFGTSKLARNLGNVASGQLQGVLAGLTNTLIAGTPYRVGDPVGPNIRPIPVQPATKGAPESSAAAKDAALSQGAKQLQLDLLKIRVDSVKPLEEQTRRLQEQNDLFKAQQTYLQQGITPALAEQFAQVDQLGALQRQIAEREKTDAVNRARTAGASEQQIQTLIKGHSTLTAQIDSNVQRVKDLAVAYEDAQKAARFTQDDRIGLGLREGAEAYVQSIGTMREATAQLAQTGIKGVEDAIFSLVTTGTANFREFAASILKDTARMIIQQLILRSVMQIIGAVAPGGGSFSKGYFDPITGKGAAGPNFGFAMGGAFAKNGIVPFAMGGVVNQPTLFKFANGGAGRLGLMGEAGPEAIMPLRRLPNGRLGVEQAGGGAPVTVNVSVDATGTSVQGNAGQGEQLGRVISQAVQAELVRQQRPGGLLSR